jgi:diguanylate cyclase (GGDEF)-like protein
VSVPQEKIQQALEAARKDGNQDAVKELEGMLGDPESNARKEILSGQTSALGTPAPVIDSAIPDAAPALSDPNAPSRPAPGALSEPEPVDPERALSQAMYDNDQELIKSPENRPSGAQVREFMRDNTDWRFGAGQFDSMQRQVVIDSKTGKPRWTALSPDQMDRAAEQEKNRGTTTKALMGSLGYGSVRPAANILQNVDSSIEARNAFQRELVNTYLPEAEQERIKSSLINKYGKDHRYVSDPGLMPANELRELIDQNPENEKVFEDIAGDEWWEQRKEFYGRLTSKVATSLRNALPFVDKDAPVNPLGADVPGGALFGREGYEDINYNERGAKAPAYAGASEDLKTFLSESKHNQGIYESVIKPLVTSKEGVMPGDQLMGVAEDIIKNTYTEEQQKERQMPFFSEDVQIEKFTDIFNADLYTDPNTKLPWQNPEAFMLTFFESAPEMGLSMAVTRGAGVLGAREGVKGALGQTISAIDKARMKSAGTYGLLAGSGTEGYFAASASEAQTKETMMEIPIERYREDSVFMAMVDSGMNEESAKQVLASDAANMAFTATFAGTVAVSGPMNKLIGQSAAGRLIGDQGAATRKVAGTLGEMGSEGMQGLSEQLAQEMAVVRIDPDNPIFDNPNRYLEAFGGEALVAGPFGLVSTVEPNAPVGIPEVDVEVARATTKYMQATNDRFKWQTKIADPEHIANTSPNQRMADLEALEVLQKAEAKALLDAEPVMRQHLETQNTQVAQTELKMLGALKMRANAMLNDIQTAQSRRTTAGAIQQEEQRIVKDRMDLQQRVNKSLLKLEDLERQSAAIESVQKREAIDSNTEAELIKEGYAKRTSTDQLVVLPKGKRAVKELNRQARGLKGRLEAGYLGTERRNSVNAVKREMVDSLGPAQREVELYQDTLTGAQNRRAFNERQENIDVREGNEKTEVEGAQPAVAAVDVDSLAWVNDNMSHSAGDRLLLAVADAIGEQEGVEVFRLGGDEFAVTGTSEEALETALQAAAKQLGDTEITAGEDAVTPQITWGKGKNYEAADAQAISMKEDRVARGKIAGRKKKAATYKHRKQQGLFQKEDLPKSWSRVSKMIERGDNVEILTPEGAVQGTVTNVSRKRSRARVKVVAQGRSFTFNPESNHLIVSPTLSPEDLAWITGDYEYADPERETLPQTLSDVQIGFLGKDGEWYADMADDNYGEYAPDPYEAEDTPAPWWTESYADLNKGYSKTVYMAPKIPVATQEEYDLAVSIKNDFAAGNQNLPPINIVRSIEQLEKDAPHVVAQIRAEGGSLTGVRGYMDHINPNNGVYVFVANISGIVGSDQFQQGVAETIIHEVIGHYGVRGVFGDEAELRPFMHDVVDSFPDLAKHYSARLGLDSDDPGQKQLLGEEMVAYIAGEQMSGKVDMTPKQQKLWSRIIEMFRKALNKMGLNRWSPVKKWNAREELKAKSGAVRDTKAEFWNDERIQSLLQRSQDFNRSGPKFSWTARYDSAIPFMRDRDIFRAGLLSAIEQATYKPTNNEKKTLIAQGKYPDKQSIPAELALFPDYGSPNIFKQAIIKAQKEGWMTARELELSGLDPNSDFYFFRDASYATLHSYLAKMNGGRAVDGWYKDILPAHLANEIQGIYEAMENQYIQGPMPAIGTMGYGEERYYEYAERPSLNKVSTNLMRERIAEILAMKIDPKKTRLTKELMKAHMLSENVYRVFVEQQGSNPQLSLSDAQERVFGNLTSEEVDALTPEQLQLVKDEKEKSRLRGPDIGYNKDLDRWLDWAGHTTEYSEWSPQGSRFNRDFRVALIKSEGRDGDMGYSGHYDANMMHIRTGVASLLNWDGMPELEYPNPEMQGKMLSLIELQSDWLQKLRKGFSSGSEKDAAQNSWEENKNILDMAGDQLGSGVSADIWTAAANLLRPITNLPSDSFGDTRGSMFEALKDRTRVQIGREWEDITDEQKRQQWKSYVNAELTKVSQQVYGAIEFLEQYTNEFTKGRELAGSIDARSFEVLDKMAVKKFAQVMISELTTLADHVQNTLTQAESQKELVDKVVYIKSRMGSRLNTMVSEGHNQSLLRLPMTTYVLKPMLDGLYEQINGDSSRVAELMSAMTVRDQATVRVPTETISDLIRAMTSSYIELELVDEIISPSRVSAIGSIAPGKISMKSVIGGDGFVDIKIIGNKSDIEKASELLPKLFGTWIQEHGSEKLRINRASRQQSSINTDVSSSYSYGDVETWLNLKTEDTDEDATPEMRAAGVEGFYEFEEQQRDEVEIDHIDNYYQNISENDWDTLEGDPIEGVSRQSSTYREAIIIEENGDTDNSDAEEALQEARDEYRRDVISELDEVTEGIYTAIRDYWHERGPTAYIHGSLPTSWDEDGESLSSVDIRIIAQDAGDAYDIYIDGSEVDYSYNLQEAKEKLSESILEYYRDNAIRPPAGELFGPESAPTEVEVDAANQGSSDPNWEIVTNNIVDNLAMISDKPLKLGGSGGVFETMVTLQKKLRGGINTPSPLADDKNWRPIALKYLIADAVRRGLGGVMWNNGLSSATRGGMGLSSVTPTDRITWSKESTTVRGSEQEVYVIRYAESSKPLVLTANRMIPALGADVAKLIRQQEMGKIEVPEMPSISEGDAESNARDKYIIATANGDTQAIYRRSDNRFLGFASTEAEIDNIVNIDNDRVNRRNRPDASTEVIAGEPFGEVLFSGMIDTSLADGQIHIMTGDSIGDSYTTNHTFGQPRLAGARQSYEDITVRSWNKELKKYGVHISDTYVEAKDMNKAIKDEAQPTLASPNRETQIQEEHGRIYVSEVTGGMHHWIVVSEKKGVLIQDVFVEKETAERLMADYIEDNYGSEREGVKVMYFPINEKMREEFSGPVAPFHYDPTEDPALKEATKKFGYVKTPLRERYVAFKQAFGHEFVQSALDQFYGLRKALNDAEVDDGAYISARLTTSLDSMMTPAHGACLWLEDGQNV